MGYYSVAHLLFWICIILLVASIMFFYLRERRSDEEIEIISVEKRPNEVEDEIKLINENQSEKYITLDGVFAVSAIIMTKENKFILMKRADNGLWVQPGTYFRSNEIFSASEKGNSKTKISLPYTRLIEGVKNDIYMNGFDYSYIDLLNSQYTEVKETFKLLTKREDKEVVT